MKKMLVGALLCALLLSLCGVTASALTVEEIQDEIGNSFSWVSGEYSGAAEDFSPVGTVGVDWDFDASIKLNLTDGNPEDWVNACYNSVLLTPDNMVNWGGLNQVHEGWAVFALFVADPDNLYMGFYVIDSEFAYGGGSSYDGDAIQLAIDFGGLLQKQVETDPEVLTNPKDIFYSFSCDGDGAPLRVMRQESDQDGWLTKEDGVVGSASATDSGWWVELSMSWDRLFEDYAWKVWDDDAKIYVGSDEKLPLNIGLCLYYLDRSETSGAINWAAGTTNGVTFDDGTPAVSWTVYDNGIRLELDYVDGMYFNCDGIFVLSGFETTAPYIEETEPEEETIPEFETYYETYYEGDYTTPWWEETTVEPVESGLVTRVEIIVPVEPTPDTEEETTRRKHNYDDDDDDDDDDRNRDDEIDEILSKYGCGAALGMGSMTALLALAAAACVCRKKK